MYHIFLNAIAFEHFSTAPIPFIQVDTIYILESMYIGNTMYILEYM